MHEQIAEVLLRVGYFEPHAVARHGAGIADLAAGLGVERRLIEDDGAALALVEPCYFLAVADECRHNARGTLGLVTEKFRGAELFAQTKPHRLVGRLAGAGP